MHIKREVGLVRKVGAGGADNAVTREMWFPVCHKPYVIHSLHCGATWVVAGQASRWSHSPIKAAPPSGNLCTPTTYTPIEVHIVRVVSASEYSDH